MEEFQQTWKLFCCHRNIRVDDKSMDDLARSIDFNNDGFIDFNEFLEAFRLVQIDNEWNCTVTVNTEEEQLPEKQFAELQI